jgi:hypothetical protein
MLRQSSVAVTSREGPGEEDGSEEEKNRRGRNVAAPRTRHRFRERTALMIVIAC